MPFVLGANLQRDCEACSNAVFVTAERSRLGFDYFCMVMKQEAVNCLHHPRQVSDLLLRIFAPRWKKGNDSSKNRCFVGNFGPNGNGSWPALN